MNESSTSDASAEHAQQVADELHVAHPEFDEVPLLEDDETVPPRPEEEVADVARQDRDA